MNAEEKQALIEFLKFLVAGSAGRHKQIYEIALAALTAPPIVKPYLPDDCDRTEAHYKYAAAIRAAGYQVEGE